MHKLTEHQTAVGCLAWSLDNNYLVTSADSDIRIYNARVSKPHIHFLDGGSDFVFQTGTTVRDCKGHDETVSALEWLPDGSGFMSGGMDRKVMFWVSDTTYTKDHSFHGIRRLTS